MTFTLAKSGPLQGEITVPGDKSISHRAVLLGALSDGETIIKGFLAGEDCLSTIRCLRMLGVTITIEDSSVRVLGVGLTGLQEPSDILDCGNSGTTARLLMGILAGQPFFAVLSGDSSLRKRPMGRVVAPLAHMGARFGGRHHSQLLPIAVQGGNLSAIHYQTPVASAQLKSAVLLAGLFADKETIVTEPVKSRDHTERMLAAFGADIRVNDTSVIVQGKPHLTGRAVSVPGDISSAAFFLVAASIIPGSDVLIRHVGINPTRTGILDVLMQMGANAQLLDRREEGGEPVADIRIQSAPLHGVEIAGSMIPRLIDELPVLAVAALMANGRTVVKDAGELRIKETDRIAAIAEEFAKIGGLVCPTEDGFIIDGGQRLQGGAADSRGDHRIAMALSVAALCSQQPVTITGTECVAISYPLYWETLKQLVT